ncbi:UBA-e1-C domain-containing protein [Mycena indigotica]|uniref:UBA-e1-C domain-containing protein n=1 Tax=Mycena indigotica TaxID=2126181 RepID=A0A8H6VP91_9AGAR|nr:UBA-e1-C domain-containing protein [Mycena indigotica]KAF7288614.1 UBA-e1-C domain-containing protein [Mycena indigotica]
MSYASPSPAPSSLAASAGQPDLAALYRGNLIPLHVVLAGLTWVLHDYLVTLEDEIRYIWPQRLNFSKIMFFWIRYYTIALLLFDVVQIHVFARPGITNNNLCVAMDTIIRVVGAVSLWSVEIIMQLRVYALYNCSRRIAAINVFLFLCSIAAFFWILIYNHDHRAAIIANAIHLPLPGCPTVHSGIEWVQWVPATAHEGVLFVFALVKTGQSVWALVWADGAATGEKKWTGKGRGYRALLPLHTILLRDNVLYFFGVSVLLVFNNAWSVYLPLSCFSPQNVTHIPWFSYGPFHAAIGIMTSRMLINLRKAAAQENELNLRVFFPDRMVLDTNSSGSRMQIETV